MNVRITPIESRILAASVGGTSVSLLVTPLDVIKARLQANQNQRKTGREVLRKMIRKEGIRTLWRGLYPTIAMQLPASACYYPTYEIIKEILGRNQQLSPFAPAVSGVIARTLTVSMISPLELIRTNLQANAVRDPTIYASGMRGTVKNIVAQHGWKQLWGGLVPTLWRDVPFSAVYWTGYDYFSKSFKQSMGQSSIVLIDFMAGACSGAVACIISHPMDVIKTRRQMTFSSSVPGANTISGISQSILNRSGYKGFVIGILPRTLKVVPSCAIMITSYEFCKRLLMPNLELSLKTSENLPE